MAFNPIAIFRKYQRFWMAGVLLMCMITFVLCTGMRRRPERLCSACSSGQQGKAVAKLNRRRFLDQEADRNSRTSASSPTISCSSSASTWSPTPKRRCSKPKTARRATKRPVRKNFATPWHQTRVRPRLERKPLYFNGGTKLADLVDFKMWLIEADRLGIQLDPQAVQSFLDMEFGTHRLRDRPRSPARFCRNCAPYDNFKMEYLKDALRRVSAPSWPSWRWSPPSRRIIFSS